MHVEPTSVAPRPPTTSGITPTAPTMLFSAWLVNRTPCRRWGEVEDLAPAAVFLASDASRFVNGHILYVDGGVTATL